MTRAYERRDDPRMMARGIIVLIALVGLSLLLLWLLLYTGTQPWPY
jgi:hypothetical protein